MPVEAFCRDDLQRLTEVLGNSPLARGKSYNLAMNMSEAEMADEGALWHGRGLMVPARLRSGPPPVRFTARFETGR